MTNAELHTSPARQPWILALGLALMAFCLLLTFGDPAMPAGDLDASWALASEYAVRHGLVFGRDFVFTFGPFNYLSTRFFDEATYPLVLAYDVLAVALVFWCALRNRSLPALAGLALCFLVLRLPSDALSPLALFGLFLIGLQRRALLPAVLILLSGPILLSKLSYGLVLAPLVLLADAVRLWERRLPVMTVAFAAALPLAYAAAGQPLSAFPDFLANSLEIVNGYSRAMQIPGDRAELVASLVAAALAGLLVGGAAVLRWWNGDRTDLRPLAVALGFAWLLFVLFKMGFVRHDVHPMVFHMGMPAGLAITLGWLDRPDPGRARRQAVFAVAILVALGASFYWRSVLLSRYVTDPAVRPIPMSGPNLPHDARRVVTRLVPRLSTGLSWVSGRGFDTARERRRKAEAALARAFPPTVIGTVDAIPWDLAPLIASGLEYRPRPVPQSYSAYTPALQQLDAAHFAGPRAPCTLFLRVEDTDGRLPTLALGPSLPVIGRHYDAIDRDALGLVLRRRTSPRAAAVQAWPQRPARLDSWIAAPAAPGRLLMARVKVDRTLAGRLMGLAYQDPVMTITLRTASGREVTYRFVPDMAQAGFAISPHLAEWPMGAPALLDPAHAGEGEAVTALRLNTGGAGWAFGDVRIGFSAVALEPGFAAGLGVPAGASRAKACPPTRP